MLVILEGGFRHIWVYDILRGSLTRLTFGETDNWSPTWSPDGSRIAFGRLTGNRSILVKPADGSGSEEALLSAQENGFALTPTSWSPDGKFLAYSQIASSGKWESGILPLEGERKAQLLLADSQYEQSFPVFSPDGKYLAYVSNESGRSGIYVIPFGHGSGKWLISAGGGANPATNPVWARNGKQLFYREGGNIMGVDVATQPVFSASTPRVFVPAAETAPLSMGLDSFDVSLDGQRFLVHQQSSDVGRSLQINVVLNWSEQLRRLAPAGSRP